MEYVTVFEEAEARHTEKRSEFIGRIAHAADESEAAAFVSRIRALERDARHNVFAYIASGGSAVRYSDDGEPQGTGGMPCLEVLKNSGLTDVVVVVTRYFGGVLLGAPGLVRAYTKAAAEAVAAARKVTMTECRLVKCVYDYTFHRIIADVVKTFGKLYFVDYREAVAIDCYVRSDKIREFVAELRNITGGDALINVSDTVEYIAL